MGGNVNKAAVLLSGGLDSGTLLSMAVKNCSKVVAISFYYGQKHEKELESAVMLAHHFGVEHTMLDVPTDLFQGAESTLVGKRNPNPHMTYREIAETPGLSPTYVPFRNSIFISMATAIAIVHELNEIWVGTHAEDARNWAYPDCTPEFNGAMANAVYIGSYGKVRLVSPFQWMMKKDIVALGDKLHTPFQLTWSCYEGGERACGKCPTCVERIEAFRANGFVDPIAYEGLDLDESPY